MYPIRDFCTTSGLFSSAMDLAKGFHFYKNLILHIVISE